MEKKNILILSIVIVVIAVWYVLRGFGFFYTPSIYNEEVNYTNNHVSLNSSLIIGGGACILNNSETDNVCVFTNLENCSGQFNAGLLCTAEELGTVCASTNIIVNASGNLFFIDSCGNQANPYDETQFTNKSYWRYSLQ